MNHHQVSSIDEQPTSVASSVGKRLTSPQSATIFREQEPLRTSTTPRPIHSVFTLPQRCIATSTGLRTR